MGVGHVTVDTAELDAAAGVLGHVNAELAQGDDLAIGADAAGSPRLATAISDFCERGYRLGTLFAVIVTHTGSATASASAAYAAAERANTYDGPH